MSTLEHMRRANPVPDDNQLLTTPGAIDAFVLSVKERSGLVGNMRETPIETKDRAPVHIVRDLDQAGPGVGQSTKRYRGWVAAAAAAVAILVFGTTLVLISGTTGERDTAAPGTVDEVGIVLSAYEALNAGNIDAWLGHFTDDALIFGGTRLVADNLYKVLSAANYHAEVVESCRRIEPTSQGETQVECTIKETDDFHATGGITLTRKELFAVNQDSQISQVDAQVIAFNQPGYYVFNQAFFDWLRVAHPDIHAEIRPPITTHLPQDPEDMSTALRYLDEFLAQSDLYPITDDS